MAEIPGTHAYVAALGVLGGIATFDNPLQVRFSVRGFHTQGDGVGLFEIVVRRPSDTRYMSDPLECCSCRRAAHVGRLAQHNLLLQGALLGPMILAALAVTFNLHVNFIGAELPHTMTQPSLSRTTSIASVESRLQGTPH